MKNKKLIIALIAFAALVAVVAGIWFATRPETTDGEKAFTLTVVHKDGSSKDFTYQTDEEYLRGALEELDGLTITGTESEYGLMIETVNGIRAVYDKDGAYWSYNVNGEYSNYGVDSQPVNDGDKFEIIYTPAE